MASSLFSNLGGLIGLAQHGVDVKPTLLRVLTDLYVQRPTHSAAEERQYVELALRLVDAVDPATRRAVVERLAAYPAAPAELVRRLGNDARPVLDGHVHDAPSGTAAQEISDRFFAADAVGRQAILGELGAFDAAPPANAEGINRSLETAVLGGRLGDFIRELERALGISRSVVERIVNDLSGEPLVVVAKALAMPIDTLQRILLLINPAIGLSVERVYALSAMYGEISAGAALHLVACWRQIAPVERRPGTHGATRTGRAEAAPRAGAAHPQRPNGEASADDVQKVAS